MSSSVCAMRSRRKGGAAVRRVGDHIHQGQDHRRGLGGLCRADILRRRGFLYACQFQPGGDFACAFVQAFFERVAQACAWRSEHRGGQAKAVRQHVLDQPTRRWAENEIDRNGETSGNAYEKPRIEKRAGGDVPCVGSAEEIYRIGHDQGDNAANRLEFAG